MEGFYDTLADGKTEAHPVWLGRKEWIEDILQRLRRQGTPKFSTFV